MENTDHLLALGEEAINIETIYLKLLLEKALSTEVFEKDAQLFEAKALCQIAKAEYHAFLDFLNSAPIAA